MQSHILNALQLIKEAEGFRSKIYLCPANKKTIGYGRNLEAKPLDEDEIKLCTNENGEIEVTEALAEKWVLDEISKIDKRLSKENYWNNLNSARKACLIDFIYNVGYSTYNKFDHFIYSLEISDYDLAARHLETGSAANGKSKYYNQTGIRAKRNIHIIRTGLDDYDFYNDHARI